MKKWLALVMSLLFVFLPVLTAYAEDADVPAPEKAHIAFGDDGKLTILQVADIQDNAHLAYLCKRSILHAVEQSKPDLIVLTGDNYAGYHCRTRERSQKAVKEVMDLFESIGVPVAMVFGNHDDDETEYTKLEQIEQYETYSCFIGCAGVVAELTVGDRSTLNAGTYNIPVYASADSDDVIYNIWCFDSGNYNPDPAYGGYGYVLPQQVDWYVETSNALREANGGVRVPSIAFQHIIPVQIYRALKEVEPGTKGAISRDGKYYTLPDSCDSATSWMGEPPSSPQTNCEPAYAEVDAMVRQGDVKAIFVGHDHINSYVIPYEGIDLVNSPAVTFHSYNDSHRGFRVITVDKENTDSYETYTLSVDSLLRNGSFSDRFLYVFRFVFDKVYVFFRELWEKISNA